MIIRQMKNSMICKFLIPLLFFMVLTALTITGCAGGFLDDNDNASEFLNPIFHPEKVETDTTGVQ